MELATTVHTSTNELTPTHKILGPLDMDRRVGKLLYFIDSHSGILSHRVEDACQELKLDISPRHAARLFKRYVRLGIMQYAKGRRLMLGAKWLSTTDLSVKAIAIELQYKSPSDFGRAFKTYFGLSPLVFRQRGARVDVKEDINRQRHQ